MSKKIKASWKIVGVLGLLLLPLLTSAQSVGPEAKIFSVDGKLKKSFFVLDPGYEGALSLAAGDFDVDGKKDLIVSALDSPRGEIWNIEGKKIHDFFAFDKFKGGMEVSAGNLDGQGGDEIIVGASHNGGPHIRGFDNSGYKLSFFGFDSKQRSGVRVLAKDLGNDGKSEIIGFSGFGQDPKFRIFGNDGHLIKEVALKEFNKNGVEVVAGDFDGDGNKEIAVAGGYGNPGKVLIFNNRSEIKSQFFFDKDYIGGLNLATGDVNGDGKDELVLTKSFGGDGKVYIYRGDGWQMSQFVAYNNGFNRGVEVAVGDFDGDGKQEIATVPQRVYQSELKSQEYKFVEVDLSSQTLKYWQNGRKLGSFLISSGLPKTPTPAGGFKIYKKRPLVRMSWYYGPNNPNNYDLPNVPWVASFSGPYTIHGAYWHNNFGHPMSHGCVNMRNSEAKIVYDFVDLGTPVIIY